MTAPKQARNALEQAVNNQLAQRMAAQESRRIEIPATEEGVEAPETDRIES